ncbi:putative universal stress protein [Lentibacillus sp. JNUCC-1]|uniref:universal stress protein n=1 Tax=Lentibacillus sp. JNUCC-1 TaxID=2654513 RepID=UPI0012E7CC1B|nr:universal stress protein [Lentibacillus sp. JNUCC-1]MUV39321.1 putative universal stress protein [Lentibacillus sp. JNUCC-1]
MEFKYERIVVAVDGSEASEKAFKKSLEIAKRNNNARLILAHVVDSRAFATIEVYDRTLTERAEEYAKELLDEYVELAKQSGVDDLVRVVEYGSPKVKIPKNIAKDFDADLIVCGATGMNAMERFLIGSVSESIARYATCDVLVVR